MLLEDQKTNCFLKLDIEQFCLSLRLIFFFDLIREILISHNVSEVY